MLRRLDEREQLGRVETEPRIEVGLVRRRVADLHRQVAAGRAQARADLVLQQLLSDAVMPHRNQELAGDRGRDQRLTSLAEQADLTIEAPAVAR